MPGSYTPGVGSISSRVWAALSNMYIGTDAPNAANVTSALKTTIDKLNAVITSAGFLGLASTWTALQTFQSALINSLTITPTATNVAPEIVSGATPTSSSATARYLLKQWGGVNGVMRMYLVYLSSTRMGIELTMNAQWSNGSSNWTADVNGYAARWRLDQPDGTGAFVPVIDTDVKTGLTAGGTWTESSFAWSKTTLNATTDMSSVLANITFNAINFKRLPSGDVMVNMQITATSTISSSQTLFALPANWRAASGTLIAIGSKQTGTNGSGQNLLFGASGTVALTAGLTSGDVMDYIGMYTPTA